MFYDTLKNLCSEHDTTPTGLVKTLGLSTSLPTAWKRGAIPHGITLQKIADYFNVTTDALLSDTPTESKLHTEKGEKIAVLASVGAGIPLESIITFDQDDPEAWEEISKIEADRNLYFALRIRGNSMAPYLLHGMVVIVRIQDHYDDGDMVIVLINNEGVCKILEYRDDGIALISLNPEYKPMVFNWEQIENIPVRIMGRCVQRRGDIPNFASSLMAWLKDQP